MVVVVATAVEVAVVVPIAGDLTSARAGQSYAGAAHIYNVLPSGKATFVETVTVAGGTTYDYAGQGLAWGSDYLGFAAYGDDTAGSYAGAFYVMTKSTVV
jgi:hypothetical protein